jgi:hypothetical protein
LVWFGLSLAEESIEVPRKSARIALMPSIEEMRNTVISNIVLSGVEAEKSSCEVYIYF